LAQIGKRGVEQVRIFCPSAPTLPFDATFRTRWSMTILQTRVKAAIRCAQEAAAVLPPAPSIALGLQHPELEEERRLLVLETAEMVSASVSHDLDVLRLAIGPALEVGVNPPWRMLLELALVVAYNAVEQNTEPDLLGDALAWLLSVPGHPPRRPAVAAI
jgi:hypothetical protein